MATKSAPRTKKTKIELHQEVENLREQYKAGELEGLQTRQQQSEKELLQSLQPLTVETLAQQISDLSLEVPKALGQISAKLVEKFQLLESIRDAIEIEKRELKKLHDIDVVATSLEFLLKEFEEKKSSIEAEVAQRRQAWLEEGRTHEQANREFEENLKKLRAREKEEFEYQRQLEKKKELDKFSEEQRVRQREASEKQSQLEKQWESREADLKSREDELQTLRSTANEFQARVEMEIKKATDVLRRDLLSQFQQEKLSLTKDMEGERRLSDLRIKSFEDTVERQFAQVENLQSRLEEAKKQVQDIALKAIEGASGVHALTHINQIAMEQAKSRNPQI